MRPLATVAALALCLAGCRGEEKPVARLAVAPRQLELGHPEFREVRLTWEPTRDLGQRGANPTVFVHLLDQPGEIVRTYDHGLPDLWVEGISFTYHFKVYQSALAPPLPPGTYRLTLGLYDGRGRRRWPIEAPGTDLGRHEYHVADVVVPPPRPGGPRFVFSPEWLPVETGGDRQVLARRSLAGTRGTIRAEGLGGPGTLWMVVHIPPAGLGEQLAVLDGSNIPAAVVSWSCGGVETGVSGTGSHEIEMPAEQPPPDGACEVQVEANFALSAQDHPRPRSVALETLAWNPTPPDRGRP